MLCQLSYVPEDELGRASGRWAGGAARQSELVACCQRSSPERERALYATNSPAPRSAMNGSSFFI